VPYYAQLIEVLRAGAQQFEVLLELIVGDSDSKNVIVNELVVAIVIVIESGAKTKR